MPKNESADLIRRESPVCHFVVTTMLPYQEHIVYSTLHQPCSLPTPANSISNLGSKGASSSSASASLVRIVVPVVAVVAAIVVCISFWFFSQRRRRGGEQPVQPGGRRQEHAASGAFPQRAIRPRSVGSGRRRSYVRVRPLDCDFEQWIAESNAAAEKGRQDDEIRPVRARSRRRHSSPPNQGRPPAPQPSPAAAPIYPQPAHKPRPRAQSQSYPSRPFIQQVKQPHSSSPHPIPSPPTLPQPASFPPSAPRQHPPTNNPPPTALPSHHTAYAPLYATTAAERRAGNEIRISRRREVQSRPRFPSTVAEPDMDVDHVGAETDLGRRVPGAWSGGETLVGSGKVDGQEGDCEEMETEEGEEDAAERRRRNAVWYVNLTRRLFRPGY